MRLPSHMIRSQEFAHHWESPRLRKILLFEDFASPFLQLIAELVQLLCREEVRQQLIAAFAHLLPDLRYQHFASELLEGFRHVGPPNRSKSHQRQGPQL
ncbi:hypothetical protein [Pyrinomonas sp.]|uniref:hypothetical protein n=1 Tax=Pyrinomonas sp. TaxID=2080306 RepID=UPI00331EDCB3